MVITSIEEVSLCSQHTLHVESIELPPLQSVLTVKFVATVGIYVVVAT